MGILDFMGDIFGSRKTQNTSTQGTSSSQSNLWPQLQGQFQQFQQQYSPNNIAGAVVPTNQYQTTAANAQMTAPSYLMPGFSTAGSLSQTGFAPQMSAFYNPWTENVVNATQANFDQQNAVGAAQTRGAGSMIGGLTNNRNPIAVNDFRYKQELAQAPVTAGLRAQGFTTAGQLAGQNASTMLGAAGTLGALTGAMTGANQSGFNMGQTLWGNQAYNNKLPFDLTNMMSQGMSPYLQAAGATTNTSGTSNGVQTSMDSPWSIGSKFLLPFMADGGAVEPHAKGGRVGGGNETPFHAKVMEAFKAVHAMREYARGGSVMPRYDNGGGVDYIDGVPISNNWNNPSPTGSEREPVTLGPWQTKTTEEPSYLKKVLSGFQEQPGQQPRAEDNSLGTAMAGLSSMLGGMAANQPRMGYATRGAVWNDNSVDFGDRDEGIMPSYAGFRGVGVDSPVAKPYGPVEEAPSESSGLSFSNPLMGLREGMKSFLPKPEGIFAGEAPTPNQRVGLTWASMGQGDLSMPIKLADMRFQELQAEREAGRLLGEFRGKPTMDAQQLALHKGTAIGNVDGFDTLAGRAQSEAERVSRLPKYEPNTGNYDAFGRPIPGWIQPENAPDAAKAAPGPYRTPSRPGAIPTPPPLVPSTPATPGAPPANAGPQAPGQPPAPASAPGASQDNPVYVPNVGAETDLIKTAPGTWYRTWDNRVKRTPDNPAAPQMSTSPPPPKSSMGPPVPNAGQQPPTPAPQQPPANATEPPLAGKGPEASEVPPPANAMPQPPPTPGMVPVQTQTSSIDPNLTGPEVLAKVPKLMQTKVLQALDGRIPPPTGVALKDSMNQQIISLAQMVDPSFDMARWANRHKMYQDFLPGGKVGSQIKSAETAINHIYDVDLAAKKLNNNNMWFGEAIRSITNPIARGFSSGDKDFAAREAAFKTKADLAVKELEKFLTGGKGGTLPEREKLMKELSSARNYSELKATTHAMLDMLKEKMRPFVSDYNREFRTDKRPDGFFDNITREKLHSLETGKPMGMELPKPFNQMTVEDLKNLPRDRMSAEQLREASRRLQELSAGPRP